jgi:hypothetical protein
MDPAPALYVIRINGHLGATVLSAFPAMAPRPQGAETVLTGLLSWGCEDCLAEGREDWVHLWVCQDCGHVGCCDNSPGRHATAHFRVAGHPVIRSYEPGEDWYWCYVDQVLFELEGAPPVLSHR